MRTTPVSTVDLEITPATAQQATIVANLLELYAHDFSEFHEVEVGDDGRYGYPDLPLYWSEPDRHPFLLEFRRKIAGFALVKRGAKIPGEERVWDMAEFFVLRRYRRRGIGSEAARQVWSRLPGKWEIRVMESNKVAYQFWARAVATVSQQTVSPLRVEINGRYWQVFSFDSTEIV
jgi:predicted acetyltransferase